MFKSILYIALLDNANNRQIIGHIRSMVWTVGIP